jgi:uncharacterized protein YciI
MPYLCYCIDAGDSAEKRKRVMAKHLAYIESIIDQIELAGPLRDEAGSTPVGSCLVYQTDDRETALGLLHQDPYYQAGVWKEVICQQLSAVAGNWVGGKNW